MGAAPLWQHVAVIAAAVAAAAWLVADRVRRRRKNRCARCALADVAAADRRVIRPRRSTP